jgi:hypothetical protein
VLRADHGVAARAIFHDDRLAPVLGDLLAEQAGCDVGRTAGRERDNDADRPVGKVPGGVLRGDWYVEAQQGQHGAGDDP